MGARRMTAVTVLAMSTLIAGLPTTTASAVTTAPTATNPEAPAIAPARKVRWKPNAASGSFTLTKAVEGTSLTVSGSGFKGLYKAYTWPENLGWQPAKGSPEANVAITYSHTETNTGYYDCQRSGLDVSASGSANVKLVSSDYVDGFRLGGPTVRGDLFARKWKVTDRVFELRVQFSFPMTVRRWSEDLASGGGCVVIEDPENGTRDGGMSLTLRGTLGANNKTVTITSFSSTDLEGMPIDFTLNDPPASGTFTFARNLRLRW